MNEWMNEWMNKTLSLVSTREDPNKWISSKFRKIWQKVSESLFGHFMSQYFVA